MSVSQWFAIAAIGRDRPGIVADLSECVYECGCNLEDASMTMLGNEFATLMLVSGTAPELYDQLSAATKRLEWERHLTVFLRPLDGPSATDAQTGTRHRTLRVTGVDQAGIVAGVARCLADQGVLISDLRGEVTNGAESGTPLYTLSIRTLISPQCDEETLARALDEVALKLDLDVAWDHTADKNT